jgi:hypothetical protein
MRESQMNSAGKFGINPKKIPDFPDQSKNGRYGTPTVFRPIPMTPYHIFIPITVFTE